MKISEIKNILNAELNCGKEFIENEVASGEKMISDNTHVCDKITEIIGE